MLLMKIEKNSKTINHHVSRDIITFPFINISPKISRQDMNANIDVADNANVTMWYLILLYFVFNLSSLKITLLWFNRTYPW